MILVGRDLVFDMQAGKQLQIASVKSRFEMSQIIYKSCKNLEFRFILSTYPCISLYPYSVPLSLYDTVHRK